MEVGGTINKSGVATTIREINRGRPPESFSCFSWCIVYPGHWHGPRVTFGWRLKIVSRETTAFRRQLQEAVASKTLKFYCILMYLMMHYFLQGPGTTDVNGTKALGRTGNLSRKCLRPESLKRLLREHWRCQRPQSTSPIVLSFWTSRVEWSCFPSVIPGEWFRETLRSLWNHDFLFAPERFSLPSGELTNRRCSAKWWIKWEDANPLWFVHSQRDQTDSETL